MQEGGVVIDVGANVGIFVIKAAKTVEEHGAVIAIEPEPRNHAFLAENIVRNGVDQIVTIVQNAARSGKGRGQLYLSAVPTCHSFHKVSYCGEVMNDYIEVDVDSLDNIASKLGLVRLDFVKIDTEGLRVGSPEGDVGYLGYARCKITVAAYHTLPDGKPKAAEVVSFLESKGVK